MEKKGIKGVLINHEDNNKHKCYVKITVSPSTKDLVMSCISEFLEHHPELKGMKITENFITRQIAEHYKRSP